MLKLYSTVLKILKQMSNAPTNLNEQLASLKSHIASIEHEHTQLQGGKKAASARMRKSLMNLKNQAHVMRSSTSMYVKELPTKTKVAKKIEPEVPEVESEEAEELPVKAKKSVKAHKKLVLKTKVSI